MTTLRAKMIRELELRRRRPNTIEAYVCCIRGLAKHYRRCPSQLTVEQVRDYLHYLMTERKLASNSVNQVMAACKFLYQQVLGQADWDVEVPLKRSWQVPQIYSPKELERLFLAATQAQPRAFLMTAYGAGLRVSELVSLKVSDIHSQRLLIRVAEGKGGKARYTLLSQPLLAELRAYWRIARPRVWLFPGRDPAEPISVYRVRAAYHRCRERAGLPYRGGMHVLRHCFASHLLQANPNVLPILQRLLGHRNIYTTMRYLHVVPICHGHLESAFGLLRWPTAEDLGHSS